MPVLFWTVDSPESTACGIVLAASTDRGGFLQPRANLFFKVGTGQNTGSASHHAVLIMRSSSALIEDGVFLTEAVHLELSGKSGSTLVQNLFNSSETASSRNIFQKIFSV